MQKKQIILIVMICSLAFNVMFIATLSFNPEGRSTWLFPELGPAVVQDSTFGRAPALETPYGLIGDILGLYSIYYGSPLQSGELVSASHTSDIEMGILAVLVGIAPIIAILILGRRSYGYSKTQ